MDRQAEKEKKSAALNEHDIAAAIKKQMEAMRHGRQESRSDSVDEDEVDPDSWSD